LLTGESYFVTREGREPFVLPPETWHPAETLPDWGVRLLVQVRTITRNIGPATVTVQATKGTRK
jgi:hypothetical protein